MSIHLIKLALRNETDPVQRANLQCDLQEAVRRASRAHYRQSAERMIEAEVGYSKPWLVSGEFA